MKSTTKIGRFERVTNLALALLETSVPLSMDQLVRAVPGYPVAGEDESLRRVFERDKQILRDEGVVIVTHGPDGQSGATYEIKALFDSARSDLVELALRPEEAAALSIALQLRMTSEAGRRATVKLAMIAGELGEVRRTLPPTRWRVLLEAAIAARRPVRFTCAHRACDVEPYGLAEHGDELWLIGRDRHVGERRVRGYRLSEPLVYAGAGQGR